MTTIYTLTDELTRRRWAYTSVKAMLMHLNNELELDIQKYYRLLKANDGKFPLSFDGFTIEKGQALNVQDVEAENEKD